MNERSKLTSKLRNSLSSRTAYIKSKLGVLVPSQIRALRLQSEMPRQSDLAKAANLHQSRISMFETPGAANMTLETLAKLAAAFRVGLMVKFVPFSEMLKWENSYSQDSFHVTQIEDDIEFTDPEAFAKAQQSRSLMENAMAVLSPLAVSSQGLVPLSKLLSPAQIGTKVPDFGHIGDKHSPKVRDKVGNKVISFKRRRRAARTGKQRRGLHGRTREERRAATTTATATATAYTAIGI